MALTFVSGSAHASEQDAKVIGVTGVGFLSGCALAGGMTVIVSGLAHASAGPASAALGCLSGGLLLGGVMGLAEANAAYAQEVDDSELQQAPAPEAVSDLE